MARAKDLTGKIFGKLVVIKRSGVYSDGHVLWECLCECGNTTVVQSNNLQKKKSTSSCGCLVGEAARKRNKEQGPWNVGKKYSTNRKEFSNKRWWSKKVKEANGEACQKCGWNKAECDVHHKIPKAQGGRNTVENGIVLCPNCHREEHSK